MSSNEIIEKITPIFKEVLDREDLILTEATTAADIEEWDSLSHIQLIVGIEKFFKIKFTSAEIASLKNVGDLCKTIQSKLS